MPCRRPKFIDSTRLRRLLRYDPVTGQLSTRGQLGRLKKGHIFSTFYPDTYIHIWIDENSYAAHRAAYVYMTGEQPIEVDHINGLRHDNRWLNLRNVTRAENCNNTRRNSRPEANYE